MSAMPPEIGAAERHTPDVTTSQPGRDRAQRLLAVGSILGAFGAASCCVIPFALFLVGVSGAWIVNLTALEPYQPIFAAISLGFIGYGAWRVYRRPKQVCENGYCATPQSDRIAKIGLWSAGVLVVLALWFPYAARYFI